MKDDSPRAAKASILAKCKQKFRDYNDKICWKTFVLISLFSMTSWLPVTAVWAELPFMLDHLPENWRAPVWLTMITVFGQMVQFLFLFLRWLSPKVTYSKAIYFRQILETTLCLMLCFFWNRVVYIFGASRSLGLFAFQFVFSFLDGLSSITFLPWIGENFSQEFIIPNYIGESLNSLVPSVIAVAQGHDKSRSCRNHTVVYGNQTIVEAVPEAVTPNFSVPVYFGCIFVIMALGSVCFFLVDRLARKNRKQQLSRDKAAEAVQNQSTVELDSRNKTDLLESDKLVSAENESQTEPSSTECKSNLEKFSLLFILFLTCLLVYGVLPSLLSYSALPYGDSVFHMAINLANIMLPVSIFVSIWSYKLSLKRIAAEFAVACVTSTYIIVIACFSPCPPLVGHRAGGYLIIGAFVLTECIFIRTRCVVATNLEKYGKNILLMVGVVSTVGQMFGGVLSYLLVDTLRLFEERPECVFDLSYCRK